jgi:hypothetical protein
VEGREGRRDKNTSPTRNTNTEKDASTNTEGSSIQAYELFLSSL